jgi:hypothetical protein
MAKVYLLICLLSASIPLFQQEPEAHISQDYQWPAEYEGNALVQLELTEQEAAFSKGFPGQVARFHDGQREIIMRYVEQATRKLHSSAECLKAHGCKIKHLPLYKDKEAGLWSSFTTERKGQNLLIKERITDFYGSQWSDVSAWYWHALFNPNTGPWLVISVIESAK